MKKIEVEKFPSYIVEKLSGSEINKFNEYFNSQNCINVYKDVIKNRKRNILILIGIGIITGFITFYLLLFFNHNRHELFEITVITSIAGIILTGMLFPSLIYYKYDTIDILPGFIKLFLPKSEFRNKSTYSEGNFESFNMELKDLNITHIEYVNNTYYNLFTSGDKEIIINGFEVKTLGEKRGYDAGKKYYYTSNNGYFTKIVFNKNLFKVKEPVWLLSKSINPFKDLSKKLGTLYGISIKSNDEEIDKVFDVYCRDYNYFNKVCTKKFIIAFRRYIKNISFYKCKNKNKCITLRNQHELCIYDNCIYIKHNHLKPGLSNVQNIVYKSFFKYSYRYKPEYIFIGCILFYIEAKSNMQLAKDLLYLFYSNKK